MMYEVIFRNAVNGNYDKHVVLSKGEAVTFSDRLAASGLVDIIVICQCGSGFQVQRWTQGKGYWYKNFR